MTFPLCFSQQGKTNSWILIHVRSHPVRMLCPAEAVQFAHRCISFKAKLLWAVELHARISQKPLNNKKSENNLLAALNGANAGRSSLSNTYQHTSIHKSSVPASLQVIGILRPAMHVPSTQQGLVHAAPRRREQRQTSQDSKRAAPSATTRKLFTLLYLSLLTSAHWTMSSNFLFFTLVESHSPSLYEGLLWRGDP